jgi:CheY-like chemotaxis protein
MPTTQKNSPTRALRIFVLEDHADTRMVLRLHLERLGHKVSTAASLREATMEIRKEEFDVLLCDIGLADGLGWNFLESLHFTKPVFTVAISGASDPQDVQRSMQAGFRHHLVKPIDFATLEQLLADATVALPATRRPKTLIE